ncbi:NAD(P)/FAD-dependent oxidoreductase [Deinococcus petrolearius]|uniref:NAD(P)/FAD-dependent oxidoreductase n=1 Tax=Deinococcus petrolearius TaxID=1751295 RepID=A0ABW1DJV5_9DEIO
MSAAPHVAVIGGGVAGASVAYALGRAGAHVTLVDAGQHAASRVPSALLNPVRGQSGKVDPQAVAGLRRTWAWVGALRAAGHTVPCGRGGVLRPVPDGRTREKFARNLPPGAELPHTWLAPADSPVPLAPGWAHALWLPEGGWLDGAAFTAALRRASGARVVRARATDWSARQVTLEGGAPLEADAVVWCGGAVGSGWAGEEGTYRAGSLLLLDRASSPVALSFGAYAAPAASGGVLGATFEAPTPAWAPPRLPLGSLGWLLDRGLALTPGLRGAQVTGRWSGTRLSELRCGRGEDGVWRLAGLGSKGFLLGPLLAQGLAGEVLAHVTHRPPAPGALPVA